MQFVLPVKPVIEKLASLTQVAEGLFVYRDKNLVEGNGKDVIGLDLDDTLLKRNSSELLFPELARILVEYSKNNILIIFTNQKGVSTNKTTIGEVENRINALFKRCGITFSVYVSTLDNKFRKPMPDMFIDVLSNIKGPKPSKFTYIGDAAGRPGDFNDSDINFLYNINLWISSQRLSIKTEFNTPEKLWEEFYPSRKQEIYNTKSLYNTLNLNSFLISETAYNQDVYSLAYTIFYSSHPPSISSSPSPSDKKPFCIFMVGYMGCSKSTLSGGLVKAFGLMTDVKVEIISRDDYGGNLSKTKKAFSAAMNAGHNIILDNTNLTLDQREVFSTLLSAFRSKSQYRKFAILTIVDPNNWAICLHLNHMRAYLSNTKPIPMVSYYTARKNQTPITLEENFTAVYDWGFSYYSPSPYYFYHYDI